MNAEETTPILVERWRGPILETIHRGSVVICDARGGVIEAWGDPSRVILPRSSIKILQALPLVESGAAARFGFDRRALALACASHQGARAHTRLAEAMAARAGFDHRAFRCGAQIPGDRDERHRLRQTGDAPSPLHNNCSGKHAGFLALTKHLDAGPDYVDPAHPAQKAARAAMAEMAEEELGPYGIDGCSAPNFAMSLLGAARAMAKIASAGAALRGARREAAQALFAAMAAHPFLVAGDRRACTALIRAMDGRTVVKTGADGVFTAILPERGLGIALKIDDGATSAAEAVIAALLGRLGALDPAHPTYKRYAEPPIMSRRGEWCGHVAVVEGLR